MPRAEPTFYGASSGRLGRYCRAVAQDTRPVRRRAGRPADTDSTATRDTIIDCARRCFAVEGFDGATNSEIGRMAGLSKGAMYHYFGSKADLYLEVCGDVAERLVSMLEAALAADHTLEGRLRTLFVEIAHAGQDQPSMIGFVAGIGTVVRRHPELVADVDRRLLTKVRSDLASLIDSASDRDDVLGTIPTPAFVDLVVVVITGLGRLGLTRPSDRHLAAGDAFLSLLVGSRGL